MNNLAQVFETFLDISSVKDVFSTFPWGYILIAAASVCILFTLLILIFLLLNCSSPIIQSAPLYYSLTLILGLILLLLSVILIYVPVTSATCFLNLFFAFLGVALIIGCILCKAIHYVMLRSIEGQNLADQVDRLPLWIFLAAQAIVLTSYMLPLILALAIAGFTQPIITPQLTTTIVCYIRCVLPNNSNWNIALNLIFCILTAYFLFVTFFMFLCCRSLRTKYHECRRHAILSGNLFLLVIAAIVVFYVPQSLVAEIVKRTVVRSVCKILFAVGVIVMLLLPRILYWRRHQTARRRYAQTRDSN